MHDFDLFVWFDHLIRYEFRSVASFVSQKYESGIFPGKMKAAYSNSLVLIAFYWIA